MGGTTFRKWCNHTLSVVAGDVCFQEAATLIPMTGLRRKAVAQVGGYAIQQANNSR
jgi:hypothetical protein